MAKRKPSTRWKLPSHTDVMGKRWKVRQVETIGKNEDDEDELGESDGSSFTITIAAKHHKSQAAVDSTLFHEEIHAVLFMTGQSELLDSKQEEALVVALENGLSTKYRRR